MQITPDQLKAPMEKPSFPKTDRQRLLNCLTLPGNQRRPLTMEHMREQFYLLESGKIDHAFKP